MSTDTNYLLTPDDAAKMLGVEPGTLAVWRCTRRYPLPWVKVGRCVRYRPEDVAAFIEVNTDGAEAVQ